MKPLRASVLLVIAVAACAKTERELEHTGPDSARPQAVAVGKLQAGPETPEPRLANPYEGNAYAASEGQRLFEQYNCAGCHFRGGGGIGPALMDDVWVYGKEPENIYATILEGRPNGMPAWRGKIPVYQVWQLVTYVESLRGDRGISSAPGPREEHLQAGEGMHSR
jgi:cytochrome c oxidase cbb3-type subunit 3